MKNILIKYKKNIIKRVKKIVKKSKKLNFDWVILEGANSIEVIRLWIFLLWIEFYMFGIKRACCNHWLRNESKSANTGALIRFDFVAMFDSMLVIMLTCGDCWRSQFILQWYPFNWNSIVFFLDNFIFIIQWDICSFLRHFFLLRMFFTLLLYMQENRKRVKK